MGTVLVVALLMAQFLVYGLRDPRTGEIRYIGKSSNGLVRPRQHASAARKGERGHKANWIRLLQEHGLSYEIVVLEETSKESLNERETWWISQYRGSSRLTNISDGGMHEGDQRAAARLYWDSMTAAERKSLLKARWEALPPETRAIVTANLTKMTREERKARAKVTWQSFSPEKRAAVIARICNQSFEEKSARGKEIVASRSVDLHKAISQKGGVASAERYAKLSATEKAIYSERQIGVNRERWSRLTPEQRHANGMLGWQTKTDEQKRRLAQGRDSFHSKLTADQRRERALVASRGMTSEERSRSKREQLAAMTAEQRKAIAIKGWETRRAARARKERGIGDAL